MALAPASSRGVGLADANTWAGNQTAPAWIASGLTGATAASRYVGATAAVAPASGTFAVGDYVISQSGVVYVCTVAGTPGTWATAATAALASARSVYTGGDKTTTSVTFVDVDATNASLTITTGARPVLIGFSGSVYNATAQSYIGLDVTVDTTRQGGSLGLVLIRNPNQAVLAEEANASFTYLTAALTAASHTFRLQWRVSAGTGNLYAGATAPLVFWAVELYA